MKKTILVLIITGFLSFSCSSGSSDENSDLEQNDSSSLTDEDSSDTGDTGNSGDSGNSGNSGDTGDTGDSGNSGDSGNTGDSGNSGNTGDTGNSGNTGNTGNSGTEGTQGFNGDFGAFRFGGEGKDFAQNIVTKDGKTLYIAGDTNSGLDTFTGFPSGKTSAFVAKMELSESDEISIKWIREIRSTGTMAQESARAITLDKDGNILVAGTTYGDLDDEWEPIVPGDVFAAKLNTDGDILWVRQWGSTDQEEYGFGITTDISGDVYVTGHGMGEFHDTVFKDGYDCFVTKISSSGVIGWSKQIGSSDLEFCYSVAVDDQGSVFVAGYTFDQVGDSSFHGTEGDPDSFLAKLNSADGDEIWIRQYGTTEGDMAFAMEYSGGKLYIAGLYEEWDNVMAVDPEDGEILWNALWYDNEEEVPRAISVGEKAIYVSGLSYMFPNQENDQDIFIAAVDFQGEVLWHHFIGTDEDDWSYGLDAADGKLFVVGITQGVIEGDGSAISNEDGAILFTEE